jgi:hypothetical protein
MLLLPIAAAVVALMSLCGCGYGADAERLRL